MTPNNYMMYIGFYAKLTSHFLITDSQLISTLGWTFKTLLKQAPSGRSSEKVLFAGKCLLLCIPSKVFKVNLLKNFEANCDCMFADKTYKYCTK